MPESDVPDVFVFKTSTYSDGGGCVEVGQVPGDHNAAVVVRNTRAVGGPELLFTSAEWHAFVCGVKDGEFDVPAPREEI